jgi:hypothetical protein
VTVEGGTLKNLAKNIDFEDEIKHGFEDEEEDDVCSAIQSSASPSILTTNTKLNDNVNIMEGEQPDIIEAPLFDKRINFTSISY